MRRFVENAGQDPESDPVHFYKPATNWTRLRDHPEEEVVRMGLIPRHLKHLAHEYVVRNRHVLPDTPERFYDFAVDSILASGARSVELALAETERAWHDNLEPEYKAWPAAIAALAATKIEIGCEHLRLPYPAIAVRLPENFVREKDGPVLRSLWVSIFRNDPSGDGSFATSSMSSPIPPRGRRIEQRWANLGEKVPAILSVGFKWNEKEDDDSFGLFSIGLVEGETLEERFDKLDWDRRTRGEDKYKWTGTTYVPSSQLVRDMLKLVVGIAFMATSRTKKEKPFVARDPKPRSERRQFEKEHGGQSQPTFAVGRDLVLPRSQGVGSPEESGSTGPGEGTGRQLKFAHYRSGHMRYQWVGPRDQRRPELVFVEPTIVRDDLPFRGRSTPRSIEDVSGTFDVADRPPVPPESDEE